MIPWPRFRQVVENRVDHRGRKFLRRQAVASADDSRLQALGLVERVHAVEVKRLARAARLLRAVEHRDGACRLWQRLRKGFRVERPIEPHLEHADFFAARNEMIHRLMRRFAA